VVTITEIEAQISKATVALSAIDGIDPADLLAYWLGSCDKDNILAKHILFQMPSYWLEEELKERNGQQYRPDDERACDRVQAIIK